MSEQVLRKVADITSFTIFYRALESISTLPPDDGFRRAKFLHQSRRNRLASAQLLPSKFLWVLGGFMSTWKTQHTVPVGNRKSNS